MWNVIINSAIDLTAHIITKYIAGVPGYIGGRVTIQLKQESLANERAG